MDEEILNAPIRVLMNKKAGTSKMEVGKDQTENLNTLLPALSGSCALLAFLDTGRNKLSPIYLILGRSDIFKAEGKLTFG